eukprot:gene895-975_t
MGRVRRYKAIKACDPFSKKKTKNTFDTSHDDPPELFEKKRRKKQRLLSKRIKRMEEMDPTELDEQALLKELESQKPKPSKAAPSIESQRKGETLQAFQKRVREETRKALLEEIPKLRKSAIRRKEKMKEKKVKKRAKEEQRRNDALPDEHFIPRRIDSSLDHHEPSSSSSSSSAVAFGERVTEPPKLQDYVATLKKAAEKSRLRALQQQRVQVSKTTLAATMLQREFV